MKFEEALAELRKGKKIRRKEMSSGHYLLKDNTILYISKDNDEVLIPWFFNNTLLDDNWEIVKEVREGWINIYVNNNDSITCSTYLYPSKEIADKKASEMSEFYNYPKKRIDCIKITWEQ